MRPVPQSGGADSQQEQPVLTSKPVSCLPSSFMLTTRAVGRHFNPGLTPQSRTASATPPECHASVTPVSVILIRQLPRTRTSPATIQRCHASLYTSNCYSNASGRRDSNSRFLRSERSGLAAGPRPAVLLPRVIRFFRDHTTTLDLLAATSLSIPPATLQRPGLGMEPLRRIELRSTHYKCVVLPLN